METSSERANDLLEVTEYFHVRTELRARCPGVNPGVPGGTLLPSKGIQSESHLLSWLS